MTFSRGQWAECGRCGVRGYAKDLIRDGRNPQLLVLKTCGCYDPFHEAERPYVPRNQEGKARYPLSPERLPPETITLSGTGSSSGDLAWFVDAWLMGDDPAWAEDAWDFGAGATLDWTRPPMNGPRVETYEVFREINDGGFSLVGSTEVEYSDFMEVLNDPEHFVDDEATTIGTYRYYVEGVTANDRRYRSNTLEFEIT